MRAYLKSGIQLLELTISLATASILMTGITGSILIANRASAVARTRQSGSLRNTAAIDRLRSDLAQAYPVSNRTTNSATLSVSDRNGDGNRENIGYRWNGVGTPLQVSMNAGAWQAVSENLNSFQFGWRSGPPQQVETIPQTLEPAPSLVFQSRTVANTSTVGKSLAVDVPETYWPGDLLVAAIAVSGNQGGSITAPVGWNKIMEKYQAGAISNDISLACWTTVAPPSMQASVNWSSKNQAYATIAHFRVQGGSPALVSATQSSGTGQDPLAPSGSANVNGSLVVRILAASCQMVDTETTNMPGHTAITLRRQLLTDPCIGMAYRTYPAGAVSSANFGLPGSPTYVTATLVFSP